MDFKGYFQILKILRVILDPSALLLIVNINFSRKTNFVNCGVNFGPDELIFIHWRNA